MNKKTGKLLTLALALLTALFVLSASIAAPILFRPFYYWQVDSLELESQTGLSREEITQAYDEMLDYCTGVSDVFSTGVLPWSESGRSHFADVRKLFLLDFQIMGASGLLLLVWIFLRGRIPLRPHRICGRGFTFWTGCGLIAVFALLGALCAIDFQRAFTLFHAVFFPGKTNWIFDSETDAIIRILPEVFFRNCGICILSVLILSCAVLILADLKHGKRLSP